MKSFTMVFGFIFLSLLLANYSAASDVRLFVPQTGDKVQVVMDVQEDDIISFQLTIVVVGGEGYNFSFAKGVVITDWMWAHNYKGGQLLIWACYIYPLKVGEQILLEIFTDTPVRSPVCFSLVEAQVNERPVTFGPSGVYIYPVPLLPQPTQPFDKGKKKANAVQIVCPKWSTGERTIRVGETVELRAMGGDAPYQWEVSEAFSSAYGVHPWPAGTWFGFKDKYGRYFWFTVPDTAGWFKLPEKVYVKITLIDARDKRKEDRAVIEVRLLLPYGDVNGDKKVSTEDADLLLKALSGEAQLSLTQQEAGDVNDDGKLDKNDVTLINAYIAGKIAQFPVQGQVKAAPANKILHPRGKIASYWGKIRSS